MKNDFELLIGRKIRGLKESDVTGRENEMLLFLKANKHLFTGAWSYGEKENMMHVQNGSFNCSFGFTSDNIHMLAKRLVKVKFEQVKPVKLVLETFSLVKKPQPVKRQVKVRIQPKKDVFAWSAYICM